MRAEFHCSKAPLHSCIWSSSRVFGGHYLVNQKYVLIFVFFVFVFFTENYYSYRLVHSFTSAGMIPAQYFKFGKMSGLGCVSKSYIHNGMVCAQKHQNKTRSWIELYSMNSYITTLSFLHHKLIEYSETSEQRPPLGQVFWPL